MAAAAATTAAGAHSTVNCVKDILLESLFLLHFISSAFFSSFLISLFYQRSRVRESRNNSDVVVDDDIAERTFLPLIALFVSHYFRSFSLSHHLIRALFVV